MMGKMIARKWLIKTVTSPATMRTIHAAAVSIAVGPVDHQNGTTGRNVVALSPVDMTARCIRIAIVPAETRRGCNSHLKVADENFLALSDVGD